MCLFIFLSAAKLASTDLAAEIDYVVALCLGKNGSRLLLDVRTVRNTTKPYFPTSVNIPHQANRKLIYLAYSDFKILQWLIVLPIGGLRAG